MFGEITNQASCTFCGSRWSGWVASCSSSARPAQSNRLCVHLLWAGLLHAIACSCVRKPPFVAQERQLKTACVRTFLLPLVQTADTHTTLHTTSVLNKTLAQGTQPPKIFQTLQINCWSEHQSLQIPSIITSPSAVLSYLGQLLRRTWFHFECTINISESQLKQHMLITKKKKGFSYHTNI